MLRPYIKSAIEHINLSVDDAESAMGIVMRGDATPAQIAAWLVALRQKGETPAEITGFARAMRAAMVSIPVVPGGAIDTCGTGGDGLSTFNISRFDREIMRDAVSRLASVSMYASAKSGLLCSISANAFRSADVNSERNHTTSFAVIPSEANRSRNFESHRFR